MQLSIENIHKTYRRGQKKALTDVSAVLEPGVYGFLGPNGAGKSTLMNIITDNLKPDSGRICLDGTPIRELGAAYRAVLGYMPQHQGLYDDFTANRFLWYMAALKGLPHKKAQEKIESVLNLVNLREEAHKKIGAFSGGMKQRILIAQALLNDPRILILDEPTAGLDPKERIRIRNFISSIAQDKIVLLATHVVSDIECIAREVLLLKGGRLLRQAPTEELIRDIRDFVWETDLETPDIAELSASYLVSNLSAAEQGHITARIVSETEPALPGCHLVRPTLEDVYLYYFADNDQVAIR